MSDFAWSGDDLMQNRAKGFYWVKYNGKWVIAEWLDAAWWRGTDDEGFTLNDDDFTAIGDKLEPPDAEVAQPACKGEVDDSNPSPIGTSPADLRDAWMGWIQEFLEARIDDAPDESCRTFARNLWDETAEFTDDITDDEGEDRSQSIDQSTEISLPEPYLSWFRKNRSRVGETAIASHEPSWRIHAGVPAEGWEFLSDCDPPCWRKVQEP